MAVANGLNHFETIDCKTSYKAMDRDQVRDKLKLTLFSSLLGFLLQVPHLLLFKHIPFT